MLREKGNSRPVGAGSAAGDPFFGGGEAGAILRSIDWTRKPIGPVESWPQSLRTALSICLSSRHPICIIWGPDRLYFYNDAYAPIVGAKHPWALGESYIAVWPEIWDTAIRPILETVEATGQASWADDLLLVLRRHGYNEECYFAFSFAPTRVEDGSVGGVFTAITETTAQVVGERRLHTLRELGARGPEAKTAEDACRIAGEVLAANRHDAPFALFYLLDGDARTLRLVTPADLPSGSRAAPPAVSLVDAASEDPWGFREALAAAQPLVRPRLEARFGDLPAGPWPEPVHTAVVQPIARPGETLPYGFMVLGASPRRALDRDYQGFFALAAGQVATAVSNARAYAEERRRAEALAELDRAKTDFFSNVSHEFRTPLTLMLGPLEELLGPRGATLTTDVRAQLQVAHRNSLRLLKLVNSLLDFSRIEAGRIDASYEPVDLAELTTELAAVFRSTIEKAGLHLVVACQSSAEPAYVDRDMWEKIVFNLLSNAYKFTARGEIIVELRNGDTQFELSVRDTGSGIAPEHQATVFKRFQRVEAAFSRTHEGTGIGLALVQELARLHGGTVTLESRPGEGSTFTVRLPRGRAHLPPDRIGAARRLTSTAARHEAFVEESRRWPAGDDPPASAPERSRTRSRVLLADDNADMRAYVQRLLQERYEVRAVADGAAALALAQTWRPDLLLSDVMMPGLDGFALTRALRADPATRAIPVILLSARAGEESRVEGLDAGADDYLIKPFGARELLARVHTNLHMAEVRRSAAAQVSASEARFEQLLSLLPVGVCACDAEGRVTFFNPRAAEIWGCAPALRDDYVAFAERFKVYSLDGEAVPESERPLRVGMREGRTMRHGEAWVERPDGTRYISAFSFAPTVAEDGRVLGSINVFQDITDEKRARLALRESEERYRAVFQQASVGIFECDLTGRIVRSNPALSRMLGHTEAELVGKNWRELVPEDERQADSDIAQELARGQLAAFTAERRYLRKDGTTGWLDVFATTVLDPEGRTARGLAVVVDVSERKRATIELRETEARFRAAADNAPVLIWMTGPTRQCLWVNQPWLDFVGLSLEAVLAEGWTSRVHPDDALDAQRPFEEAFEARQPFTTEFRLRRHDGVYRWMLSRGVPRHVGTEFAGYIGSCVDIEDRKRAEAEVAHARDEAVAASRAKDDFLAALSHELRTPLSPVLLLASEAALDPALPPALQADFETIRKSIELEARLIDDLLDLTRITRNKLVLDTRPTDVAAVLRDALATVHGDFAAKTIEVSLALPDAVPPMDADPVRLQQVFWNVLKNAVKFTPAGGQVSVTLRVPANAGEVVVEIADTGIGITGEELARVFDAFSQGDHASGRGSHRFGGLGLGLAISQRVVELHGGRIAAESAGRGRGALFRICLPLAAHDRGATATPAPSATPFAPPQPGHPPAGRLLLVEDHAATRAALELLLRRRNYAVQSAATAAEALALAESKPFDLVLSDIGLPDGNGYALMSELRQRHGLQGIALTGYGMEADLARSESAGFVLHLTKPVRMEALDKALAQLKRLR